jgi:protein TonB
MLAIKSSRANLESCTRLFLLLGLVGAMIIASISIEYKSKNIQSVSSGFGNGLINAEEENIPEAKVELEVPKSAAPIPSTPILEQIKIVSDDQKIKETVLASTETDENEAVVVQKIVLTEVKEEKITEEVTEDVPFFIIEDVPKFPGCKGTNEELRKCMQENVQKFVYENFNVSIAEELNLEPGIQRIFVAFVIDKNGNISNVESRAPHKSLQIEAERVIKSLPQMVPGKQRGKPVGVKYSLPIVFEIMPPG